MQTERVAESEARAGTIGDVLSGYAALLAPLAFGVLLILLGYVFDLAGMGVEAGVAAASGLIICAIGGVVYGIFWVLGRFGH